MTLCLNWNFLLWGGGELILRLNYCKRPQDHRICIFRNSCHISIMKTASWYTLYFQITFINRIVFDIKENFYSINMHLTVWSLVDTSSFDIPWVILGVYLYSLGGCSCYLEVSCRTPKHSLSGANHIWRNPLSSSLSLFSLIWTVLFYSTSVTYLNTFPQWCRRES